MYEKISKTLFVNKHPMFSNVMCPVCRSIMLDSMDVSAYTEDNFQTVRVISFEGVCGHKWQLEFRFHAPTAQCALNITKGDNQNET